MNPGAKSRYGLYLVLVALFVALAARGLISQEEAKLWTEIASYVIGAGGFVLAASNVPGHPGGRHRKPEEA